MKTSLLSLLFLFPIISSAQEYDTIRVCTYNLLSFNENDLDLIDKYRIILNKIRPQVLTVQEITSTGGYQLFIDSIASKLDIPLEGVGIKYDAQHQSYTSAFFDPVSFRGNGRWVGSDQPSDQLALDIYHRGTNLRLAVISLYWNAGTDPVARLDNAERTRSFEKQLKTQVHGLIATGNFNVYTSEEQAYQDVLKNESGEQIFFDPIDRPGNWSNNEKYATLHTQSTRGRQFGEGTGGGLNNRFDQVLLSDSLLGKYIPGSYTIFGNDGNHFNDSINAMPNTAVSPVIAQALHDVSDHLPVYLDLVFERKTVSVEDEGEWVKGLLDLW